MAIFDIKEVKEEEVIEPMQPSVISDMPKDRFFSSMTARILFFLLLMGDLIWLTWSLAKMTIFVPLALITMGKVSFIKEQTKKGWLSLKRSGVCALSLIIALFSPALGIMVACTYFLMYDKSGIQDVVPRSLQDQFQEFITESK
jgi:hypothetical protein